MLMDTHAHLNMPDFSDIPEVLERARAEGITAVIDVGFDLESSKRSVSLANSRKEVFSSVGIHPHDAEAVNDVSFAGLAQLARDKRVVAIGETGLDYHGESSPKEAQQRAFMRHIELAASLDLPLIVHSRDAHEDTLRTLRECTGGRSRGVMHCFSGDEAVARAALDLGLYVSFAGNLTFPKAEAMRAMAAFVPIDRILLETDCPYLAPVPVRGRRNEPSFMIHTARVLAGVRKMDIDELCTKVNLNARSLFSRIGA